MTIIKNKIAQMIFVGLLFAVILGSLSATIRYSPTANYENQIVIVDIYYKNRISEYINKLNQIGFLNRDLLFNQELFSSLNYIMVRYQKDKRLNAGCWLSQMSLTDNSIFIETEPYPSHKKNLMDQCFENLFDLAYKRLKEKLDIYNYRDLSLLNFEISNDKINPGNENKESLKFEDVTKVICTDLDKIINNFNLQPEDKNNLNKENDNIGENYLSIFNLHQRLIAAKTLEQICDNSFAGKNKSKEEFIFHLNALNNLIADTEFNELFKVEKIYTLITNKTSRFLSTKNIITTFSIFGFIFGVLLVHIIYNLRSSKDNNE